MLSLVEQKDFGLWELSTGARIEFQDIEQVSTGLGMDGSAKNLSLAALRELGEGYSFILNLAIAERFPVAEELYANGPHLATSSFEIGNSSLDKETSNHFDIGIRKTSGTVTWSVTGFRTSYDNFIYLKNSGKEHSEHELAIFNFTQGGADLFGYEAEIFTPIATLGVGEVDMRLFADYVEGDLAAGGYLPRLPPLRIGGRMQYHDDSVTIGLEATHTRPGEKRTFETNTQGYTMINADFSRSFVLAGGTGLMFSSGAQISLTRKHENTRLSSKLIHRYRAGTTPSAYARGFS
ncbi:MAG: hypothetical protein CM1200mP36_07410 [Gammaproteobacteria bacterium]|nr:MAG: hypothetical protein CM1200mP36_07410 [Gammaproteobacteria bacterium]